MVPRAPHLSSLPHRSPATREDPETVGAKSKARHSSLPSPLTPPLFSPRERLSPCWQQERVEQGSQTHLGFREMRDVCVKLQILFLHNAHQIFSRGDWGISSTKRCDVLGTYCQPRVIRPPWGDFLDECLQCLIPWFALASESGPHSYP